MALEADLKLTGSQRSVLELPMPEGVFLEGPPGTGKTTVGLQHLSRLLSEPSTASIVIWVPQRTLAHPYYELIHSHRYLGSSQATILTLGGLARRMVELFWPIAAQDAGFSQPDLPPTFLTLETAQYFMSQQVRPLLDEGYFSSITIEPHRLYSQILDNLNKSALVGFPYSEIAERLSGAWVGDESQLRVYNEAQECAQRFRQACLQNNLLDFSLQVEVFLNYLWRPGLCKEYLSERYQHLIVDNPEEDAPAAHDLLAEWAGDFETRLFIYDHGGGYRRFLAADPERANELRRLCRHQVQLETPIDLNPGLQSFAGELAQRLGGETGSRASKRLASDDVAIAYQRYQPELLAWVADETHRLITDERVAPDQIVILSPFLSDALRFSLTYAFEQREIPVRSHRPSRALREEPAVRGLLTLLKLAHPQWGESIQRSEIAHMLMIAIDGMDAVRASLLAEVLFRPGQEGLLLLPFAQLTAEMKERLTFSLGERYDKLLGWLQDYSQENVIPPEHFISRLFGELLAQPGFGFHTDLDSGQLAATLIESIAKFRAVVDPRGHTQIDALGRSYLRLVDEGLVAAQYLHRWQTADEPAVLLAPAYTYLVTNRMVDFQFWLNVGGSGWWERLYQPLTHPYVLSRHWPKGKLWQDQDEHRARQEALRILTEGLLRRCRRRVYLGLTELGENGYEQQGPLLTALHRIMLDQPGLEVRHGF